MDETRLFLISGDDDYAIKARTRELIVERCGEPPEDNPDLEIISGDSDQLKADDILCQLLNALTTPPFLSSRKIVWLKHFAHFKTVLSSKNSHLVKLMTQLTDFIKSGIPMDVVLIMDGQDIDQRKAFCKACKTAGKLFFFKKSDLSSKDFSQSQFNRIEEICAGAGKRIERRAMQFLVDTVGSDTGRLHTELEKIICFVDEKPLLTLEDCQLMASRTPETLSWEFANCLTERRLGRAFEVIAILVEQMRASGQRSGMELALLSQAIKLFQDMVKTRGAMAQLNLSRPPGKSYFYSMPDNIKERYPNNTLLQMHPFRAYKLCETAGSFSDRKLAEALKHLLEANRKLVSGGNARITLEQLVIKIIGQPR